MQTRLKITFAYDGTRYFGWQKTKTGPSIQDELEKALATILQHPVKVEGASRTDRGVHSLGQVAHFDVNHFPKRLAHSLNQLLPDDIHVQELIEVDTKFHATLDNSSKTYRYELSNSTYQSPFNRLYQWHYPYDLNIDKMQKACEKLKGAKSFKALTNQKKNETYTSFIRDLTLFSLKSQGPHFTFILEGNHFLYKMARNLVGLVVYIGRGKIELDEIDTILNSEDRKLAGITAPAHGLFLDKVKF